GVLWWTAGDESSGIWRRRRGHDRSRARRIGRYRYATVVFWDGCGSRWLKYWGCWRKPCGRNVLFVGGKRRSIPSCRRSRYQADSLDRRSLERVRRNAGSRIEFTQEFYRPFFWLTRRVRSGLWKSGYS